jgi:chromosome segregation ATPase
MAIQGTGPAAAVASYAGGQIARQQAARSAEQLEAKAAALAAEASSARREADSAQRQADDLQTQAGQARTRADLGKQAVAAARGMDRSVETLSATVDRVARAIESQAVTVYTASAQSQTVSPTPPGQIIDVSA